jgi:hypothetical protein
VCQEKWEEVGCEMSSKCLTSKSSLGLHLRRQHEEEEGDFLECTKRSWTSRRNANPKKHIKTYKRKLFW